MLPQTPCLLVPAAILVASPALAADEDLGPDAPGWLSDQAQGDPLTVVGFGRAANVEQARATANRAALHQLFAHLESKLGAPGIAERTGDPSAFLEPSDRYEATVGAGVVVAVRYRMREPVADVVRRLQPVHAIDGLTVGPGFHGDVRVRAVSGRFVGRLRPGDQIVGIDGSAITDWRMVRRHTDALTDPTQSVELLVRRAGAPPIPMVVAPTVPIVEPLDPEWNHPIAPTCGACCHGQCDDERPVPLPDIRDKRSR